MMRHMTLEEIKEQLSNYRYGERRSLSSIYLVWYQYHYEGGSYYTACRDRKAALRVVKELRKKYRRSFHPLGKKGVAFTGRPVYLKLKIES